MSEQARINDDEQRTRARAWQREQARETLSEIHDGAPGHREVSEEEFEAGWDRIIAAAEQAEPQP
ncbi:MAG: hypothetical protein ACYDGR_02450 [Candidatus Dormibacteria bacterium]